MVSKMEIFIVTDCVEDIYVGSSTTIVGAYSSEELANKAMDAHKEKTMREAQKDRDVFDNLGELREELDRCVTVETVMLDK